MKIYNSLLTLVRDFWDVEYSIGHGNPNEFIPGLYCNQSSIENLFSNMRPMRKDRIDLYAVVITQRNIFINLKYSKKNTVSN